jgi:nucleotide-binding universal stress UspA family protein
MNASLLVPMDGSPFSRRALDHALSEAKRCGGSVHVLRVVPPIDDYGMVPAYITKEHRREMAERAREALDPALARARAAGVACEPHVLQGEIAPTIVRAARRLKCGGIVMGTHGRGTAACLVLGSVATKVVHLAKLPVTLVK